MTRITEVDEDEIFMQTAVDQKIRRIPTHVTYEDPGNPWSLENVEEEGEEEVDGGGIQWGEEVEMALKGVEVVEVEDDIEIEEEEDEFEIEEEEKVEEEVEEEVEDEEVEEEDDDDCISPTNNLPPPDNFWLGGKRSPSFRHTKQDSVVGTTTTTPTMPTTPTTPASTSTPTRTTVLKQLPRSRSPLPAPKPRPMEMPFLISSLEDEIPLSPRSVGPPVIMRLKSEHSNTNSPAPSRRSSLLPQLVVQDVDLDAAGAEPEAPRTFWRKISMPQLAAKRKQSVAKLKIAGGIGAPVAIGGRAWKYGKMKEADGFYDDQDNEYY